MTRNQIGARLRTWIELIYETQFEACRSLDIQPSTLYRYMAGTNSPSADFLMKLAETGLSISWMLTGEGSMYADSLVGQSLRSKHDQERSTAQPNGHSSIRRSTGYAPDL